MKYLVFQIGCIECGVSSYPIQTTYTLEEAKRIAENHPSTWDTEGGEGYAIVIDLEACTTVWDGNQGE